MSKVNIYIDGNNLYRSAKELGYEIDYKKFRGWLRQKYNPTNVYLFIGLVPSRTSFYEHLQECGFILIFKQTITVAGKVKGNCDAELVLKTVSDFYTKAFTSCILITGDGDFGCLVEFLQNSKSIDRVISPDEQKCSILIKKQEYRDYFLKRTLSQVFFRETKRKSPRCRRICIRASFVVICAVYNTAHKVANRICRFDLLSVVKKSRI